MFKWSGNFENVLFKKKWNTISKDADFDLPFTSRTYIPFHLAKPHSYGNTDRGVNEYLDIHFGSLAIFDILWVVICVSIKIYDAMV